MCTSKVLGGRTRYCRWCGTAFTESKNHRIYCSDTCEEAAYRTHGYSEDDTPRKKPGRLLEPEVRICRRCGNPFITNHEGRRYCSDKCRYHGDMQALL